MNHIEIDDLLKAGTHFGHPTSRWNPNFKPFLATKKNGIHIIDLKETSKALNRAGKEVTRIVREGGHILFVGTKKQAKDVVQQASDRCGMYYIVERWLGGTLTNYATIKRSIKRLSLLEKESSPIYENLTKKELGMLARERIKLADLHRGIKDMKHLPSAIFFIDGICEKIAIAEAKTLGIPVMGIVDSNTDPTNIDFPIPGNDDSMKSIGIIVDYIANCVIEAQGGSVEEVAELVTAEVETASALDSTEVVEEVAELVVEESNVEQK
jgi:small subunit ribosomal protein S2